MNRLRTGGSARISFFSFQDIITSVTGILILVTLMLSFSMQTGDAAPSQEQRVQSTRARLAELEQQNRVLQQRRLEAASVPDAAVLRAQVGALQRELAALTNQAQTAAAALERLRRQSTQSTTNAELREEISNLDQQLAQARQQLASARTNANLLQIVPDPNAPQNSKTSLVIVVSADRLHAQRLTGADTFDTTISDADTLRALLNRFNRDRDLLVFYFRPSGVKWFEPFRALARASGFEVGYDAVEENKQIVFAP